MSTGRTVLKHGLAMRGGQGHYLLLDYLTADTSTSVAAPRHGGPTIDRRELDFDGDLAFDRHAQH